MSESAPRKCRKPDPMISSLFCDRTLPCEIHDEAEAKTATVSSETNALAPAGSSPLNKENLPAIVRAVEDEQNFWDEFAAAGERHKKIIRLPGHCSGPPDTRSEDEK